MIVCVPFEMFRMLQVWCGVGKYVVCDERIVNGVRPPNWTVTCNVCGELQSTINDVPPNRTELGIRHKVCMCVRGEKYQLFPKSGYRPYLRM